MQRRTRKISEGGKFRHNRVTSQSCDVTIQLKGSAEGKTTLGRSGACSREKIAPKNTHFCAFWKQILDNTVYTFFYF